MSVAVRSSVIHELDEGVAPARIAHDQHLTMEQVNAIRDEYHRWISELMHELDKKAGGPT